MDTFRDDLDIDDVLADDSGINERAVRALQRLSCRLYNVDDAGEDDVHPLLSRLGSDRIAVDVNDALDLRIVNPAYDTVLRLEVGSMTTDRVTDVICDDCDRAVLVGDLLRCCMYDVGVDGDDYDTNRRTLDYDGDLDGRFDVFVLYCSDVRYDVEEGDCCR